jgi:PAS domain S-box-containing protein
MSKSMSEDNYLKEEFDQRLHTDPALFDFLQAGSLDGIWYWDIERPENEWMSPRFWELFGYDPATKKHLASEWQEMIDPDDLLVAIDNFHKHCADPSHPYDQIVRYRHRDGSTVWVRCRGIAIRDQNGKPIRMLGAHNDLTQVMRLKQELAQAIESLKIREHEARSILENSPDTIARYDRNCRRIYVNPAFVALADGGAAALLGKKPSEIPGGANAEVYENKIHEVFATGENSQFELKWLGKDGNEICSHIRLTPEFDPAGNITTVLGIGRDISEMNEYRNELKRKNAEKTRFLAAAGHDMRQPVAAATLLVEALKLTAPNREQHKLIERLDQSTHILSKMLERLLDISKFDAGLIKPQITSFKLGEVAKWLDQNFTHAALNKQLRFRLFFPDSESLTVRTDIGLLQSVLMNLVSNAIKFTARGGILVSARLRGDSVLMQVWDTGIGIPEADIAHIFDEFYQVGNPQRSREAGLGLGLSICQRALSVLGCELICRSRLGHGSVFQFSLQLSSIQTEADPLPVDDDTDEIPFKSKSAILVEDDLIVAQAMASLLELMGMKIRCFHNAEDTMSEADIEHTDYYIVDYMLGGGQNGIQLLNQLRQKRGKSINAVLVTGDTSTNLIRQAEHFDWPVLHKPVSISKLISKLRLQEEESF